MTTTGSELLLLERHYIHNDLLKNVFKILNIFINSQMAGWKDTTLILHDG